MSGRGPGVGFARGKSTNEMMTNLLRGKSGTTGPEGKGRLTIGETDARVFDCPACGRPLSDGTWP